MITRRIKAFLIDYSLMLLYMLFLFGATVFLSYLFDFMLNIISPVKGEVTGFVTLTLPVILYFTFCEHSRYAGTLGKRKYRLCVLDKNAARATYWQLLARNGLKFLPWELAHFFVFRLFYFLRADKESPWWVIAGLIGAQLLALLYLLSVIFNRQHRGIYETLSGTMVATVPAAK